MACAGLGCVEMGEANGTESGEGMEIHLLSRVLRRMWDDCRVKGLRIFDMAGVRRWVGWVGGMVLMVCVFVS
jgi:hypothetical protein